MSLSEELLQKLACPKCKGPLEYREDDNRLDCRNCKLSYRIEEDIPVLLIDEAESL